MNSGDLDSWGRWGPEDESGSLNLITKDSVLASLRGPVSGEVIELGIPLGPTTPSSPHRGPIRRFMTRDGGDYAAGAKRPGGFQFAEDEYLLPAHAGTHIDSLAHAWHGDLLYNGFDPGQIRSTTGAQRCGADKLKPVMARGVLLDFARDRPLEAGHPITDDDVMKLCAERSIQLAPGDVVLTRTGWMGHAADAERYFSGEPGIDLSAARHLAKTDVLMVGADNCAIEPIPFPDGEVFPVHQFLLRDRGVPLIENLGLDELAARGVTEFLFVALPLRLEGGTASPVNPVAVI